ncbi:MAG: hypothetical protein Q4C47_06740, partial [Planctomycetia bacterium]|nr:hypothetical protein [Planctomycetia bacterium]
MRTGSRIPCSLILTLAILASWMVIFRMEYRREWRDYRSGSGVEDEDGPGGGSAGENREAQPWILQETSGNGISRVDRCRTCHDDRIGPNAGACTLEMDRIHTSEESKGKVRGCTVCHGGRGESVGVVSTGHLPSEVTQRERWTERYGYLRPEPVAEPVVSGVFAESGCLYCHADEGVLVPSAEDPTGPAPELLRGFRLIREYRCAGCHRNDRVGVPLPDPGKKVPLLRAGDRMTSASIRAYLVSPRSVNPHAKMPRLFGTTSDRIEKNELTGKKSQTWMDGLTGKEIDDLTVIANWIASQRTDSDPETGMASRTDTPENVDGVRRALSRADHERGKRYFVQYGCAACHAHHELPDFQELPLSGPGLSGVATRFATRTSMEWICRYVLNPSDFFPDGRMPRIDFQRNIPSDTSDPIADIVAFLYGNTEESTANDLSETCDLPATSDSDPKDRLMEYGCTGCHEIPGVRETRIGPSINLVGRRSIHLFGFGQASDRTRWNSTSPDEASFLRMAVAEGRRDGFLSAKILEPRAFQEPGAPTLKMGVFQSLTPEDRRAIVTFLLGTRNEHPTTIALNPVARKYRIIAAAEAILQRYGCRACHEILPEHRMITPYGATIPRWVPGIPERTSSGTYREIVDGNDRVSVIFHPWETVATENGDLFPGDGSILVSGDAPYTLSEGGGFARILATLVDSSSVNDLFSVPGRIGGNVTGTDTRPFRERTPPSLFRIGERIQASVMERWIQRPEPYRREMITRMPVFPISPYEARTLTEFFHL